MTTTACQIDNLKDDLSSSVKKRTTRSIGGKEDDDGVISCRTLVILRLLEITRTGIDSVLMF